MYREDPTIFAYYDDCFSDHEYLRHDFRRSWRSEFEERDAAPHAGDIFNRPDAPTRKIHSLRAGNANRIPFVSHLNVVDHFLDYELFVWRRI